MRLQRFLIVIALAGIAFAQSSTPVIGVARYSAPVPLTVAPGQLVTLCKRTYTEAHQLTLGEMYVSEEKAVLVAHRLP